MVASQQVDGTDGRTVLAGIATPVSDIALPTTGIGTVLAIVSVHGGTLGADTTPGAAVRGAGSGMLWITGEAAAVNAKLGTLVYTAATAGTDTLTVMLLDAAGALSTPVRLPLSVVPFGTAGSTPVVAFDAGTLTLDSRVLDGPGLSLTEPAGSRNATSAILINTTLGARSTLSIRNNNPAGGTAPRLALAGRVELDGATSFDGNGTAVTIAQNGTLLNRGAMLVGTGAAQFGGTGTLVNDGSITVDGDGATGGTMRIDTTLAGGGQVVLTGNASISLATVGAGQTVRFGDGADTMHLTRPAAFGGVIAGFSYGDAVVLDGTAVTAAFYSATTGTGQGASVGTLALFNGQVAVGSLRFDAPEAGTVFQLGMDASNDAVIRLAPVPQVATPAGTDVYRFFDAVHGTQLLTDTSAERDAIAASRTDLRYEGVAFQAVQPAGPDANTVAVYRFFDTTNGTHLLTASATERDTLLGTKPDLVFEPTSTMFEHAAAQADDVPVYRFFDNGTGAHFFTGSADERASILATRPDLVPEGIAFYAPRG